MRLIDADALIEFCAERWIPLNIDAVNMQPTIEPSTSCSEFPNNSDTISRQAAIDALDFEIVHMTAYCDGKNEGNPFAQYNKGLEDGKKAIEALPTIQPQSTTGQLNDGARSTAQSTDLIDRQAAIKALHEQANQMTNWAEIYKQQRKGILTATNIIKDLPSAQPEPSIPLSWVEKHIEWLKGIDNEFAKLAAAHISVMVKKWRDEQDETD